MSSENGPLQVETLNGLINTKSDEVFGKSPCYVDNTTNSALKSILTMSLIDSCHIIGIIF